MLLLITYDVNTETSAGKSRLRKVAKQCVNYGIRVQNSVFECVVDSTQAHELKFKLKELIDTEKTVLDSIILAINTQIVLSITELSLLSRLKNL